MKNKILTLLIALLPAFWASAQDRPKAEPYQYPFGDIGDTSRGVFGVDDRSEASKSIEFKDLVRATAVMIRKSKMVGNNQDGYRVYSETLRKRLTRQFGTDKFHENVKFLDQPACASCTGFLISPDILVTAGPGPFTGPGRTGLRPDR